MTSGRPDLQRRICRWYLEKYHPGVTTYKYQLPVLDERLLPDPRTVPEYISNRWFNRALPRIDLFIALPDHIEIVEAKAKPKLKDVADLKFYANAFKHDPRSREYEDRPWKLVFVTPDHSESIKKYAEEFGITYIHVPYHELPEPSYLYRGTLY